MYKEDELARVCYFEKGQNIDVCFGW